MRHSTRSSSDSHNHAVVHESRREAPQSDAVVEGWVRPPVGEEHPENFQIPLVCLVIVPKLHPRVVGVVVRVGSVPDWHRSRPHSPLNRVAERLCVRVNPRVPQEEFDGLDIPRCSGIAEGGALPPAGVRERVRHEQVERGPPPATARVGECVVDLGAGEEGVSFVRCTQDDTDGFGQSELDGLHQPRGAVELVAPAALELEEDRENVR